MGEWLENKLSYKEKDIQEKKLNVTLGRRQNTHTHVFIAAW